MHPIVERKGRRSAMMVVVRGRRGRTLFLSASPSNALGCICRGLERLSRSSVDSRSSRMAFPKKGVRVFLLGARVGGRGIENGATERNSGRGRMSTKEGLRRWRGGGWGEGLLGFLIEMRLPPPPVASSWHVPPNLNALAPLNDDAHISIIHSRILRHRNDVICNSCKPWKIFLLNSRFQKMFSHQN